MVIVPSVLSYVPVNDRAFGVLRTRRLAGVQMQERRGSRTQLHAEAHKQDEAEPLHLRSIVADLPRRVKDPTSGVTNLARPTSATIGDLGVKFCANTRARR